MTVYRAPASRPYQRRFRVFTWSGIAVMLGIALFSIFEPQNVSRSTNIALAVSMGAMAIAAVVYGLVLPPKEALLQRKQSFQWELTEDKLFRPETVARLLRFL